MNKYKVNDVVVLGEQIEEHDTLFRYGQLGVVLNTSPRYTLVKCADNDFDGVAGNYCFEPSELTKIGVL